MALMTGGHDNMLIRALTLALACAALGLVLTEAEVKEEGGE
jgi:hypothetical protein